MTEKKIGKEHKRIFEDIIQQIILEIGDLDILKVTEYPGKS